MVTKSGLINSSPEKKLYPLASYGETNEGTPPPNDILPVNGTKHASLRALPPPFHQDKFSHPVKAAHLSQQPPLNSIFHVICSLSTFFWRLCRRDIFSRAVRFSIVGQFALGKKWFSQNTGCVSAYLAGFSEDRFKDFRHSLGSKKNPKKAREGNLAKNVCL
ncbi:hypothetical protein CDAR_611231 [Caerostris darwini]|uniref:Uncharacterized protein n=1 Tax=Caerostris darwini TaxID=1538125 RepID=A0AAV4TEW2_9ARAC|nr:hypothetical protein CDAR_611231 [Caerostris darwini]